MVYVRAFPFDSDEPQHLHVAWAWTRGLLPYRDVFDNHAPLFHAASAPLLALIGERPWILVAMRFAVAPFFALALAGSWVLARRLFGPRAAAWAALLCGLSPTFFFKTLEYRPDIVWGALWTVAVALLVGGWLDPRRGFAAGLLLGACLAISMKSVMLLAALLFAALGAAILTPPVSGRSRGRYAAATAAGTIVLPGLVVAFFAARGALADLYFGTIGHNLVSGVGTWETTHRPWLLAPFLVAIFLAARAIRGRVRTEPGRVVFLVLLVAAQYVLLATVWPVHTRQDLVPFYPLFTVLLAGWLTSLGRMRWARALPALLATAELAVLPVLASPLARGTAGQERMLAEVLALTGPADFVLDLKGQAVFRHRPYYYALEKMTQERIERGLLPDTIPESCVATRTHVAQADIKGFPARTRVFLADNYVVVGAWRVSGRVLDAATPETAFEIPVPGVYGIVGENGAPAAALLDGTPYDGPRDLAAGRHTLRGDAARGRLALLWAPALERGFSPFAGTPAPAAARAAR